MRKLASFAGRADQAIFVGSSDGRLEWANDAACRLCGLAREELLGRRLELFPDDPEAERTAATYIRAQLEAGEHARVEASLSNGVGRVRWVELEVVPIPDEGRDPAWVAVARDVTERKHAEDAVAETEERYRSLAEVSPEPVAVHSGGRVVYANPAALELLGAASGDEVLERPIFDFVHPDFRGLVAERIHKMEAVGDPAAPVAETLLRVDGSPVEVELAAMPIVWRSRPAIQLTGRVLASEALREGSPVDLAMLLLQLSTRIDQKIAPRAVVSFDLTAAVAAEADEASLGELASTLVAQAAASLPGRRGGLRVRTWTRELDANELAGLRSDGVRSGRFATLEVTALGPDASRAPRARLFDPTFAETFPGCGPGLARALAIARAHGGALGVTSEAAGGLRIEACLPAAPRPKRFRP